MMRISLVSFALRLFRLMRWCAAYDNANPKTAIATEL